ALFAPIYYKKWSFTIIRAGLSLRCMDCSSMNIMFGLFNLGGGEIILILALILILFGAKKLPELAKGLGQGIKEFKKATKEVTEEIQSAVDEDHYNAPPPRKIDQSTEQKSLPENADSKAATVPHSTEHKP